MGGAGSIRYQELVDFHAYEYTAEMMYDVGPDRGKVVTITTVVGS